MIFPGFDRPAMMETGNVLRLLCPQPLIALTVMLPPAVFVVAVMVLVLDVPLHPEGSVQT